jgi:para-nitrobenzyl esterase
LTAIAQGNAAGVHVLTGTNRHEMTLFMMQDPGLGSMTDDVVRDRLTAIIGEDAGSLVDDYRSRRPDVGPQELWLDIATDRVFRMPAIALLEAQAQHAPTWLYLFTYETPVFGGILKSTHALEIPFVFDALESAEIFTGSGPELAGLAEAMHQSWIAFARTGDPNHEGLPVWPRYDRERRATMRFDTVREVLDDPAGADRVTFFAQAAPS